MQPAPMRSASGAGGYRCGIVGAQVEKIPCQIVLAADHDVDVRLVREALTENSAECDRRVIRKPISPDQFLHSGRTVKEVLNRSNSLLDLPPRVMEDL